MLNGSQMVDFLMGNGAKENLYLYLFFHFPCPHFPIFFGSIRFFIEARRGIG